MVSVKDVARAAGVSLGTVSNVLNRPDSVTPDRRERVERAIVDLGFVRNETARQLRSGASRTIAVVVLDVANPFFTDIVAGVEQVADAHGALVVVCNSGGSAERERRHLERLEQQRVLGVLLSPVEDEPSEQVTAMLARGTPLVLVDRGAPGPGDGAVSVDDVRGGELAGRHLVAAGHRRIGFVGGPLQQRQVVERLAGLRAAAAGTAEVEVMVSSAMSVPAGSRVVAEALGSGRALPSALFCANDLLAIGVLNECLRRGVRVPQDVAIVGYDDISFAATTTVALTSVRQPREELGRTAAQVLLERAGGARSGGAGPARQVVFEPELVVRASTLDPAGRAEGAAAPGARAPR